MCCGVCCSVCCSVPCNIRPYIDVSNLSTLYGTNSMSSSARQHMDYGVLQCVLQCVLRCMLQCVLQCVLQCLMQCVLPSAMQYTAH